MRQRVCRLDWHWKMCGARYNVNRRTTGLAPHFQESRRRQPVRLNFLRGPVKDRNFVLWCTRNRDRCDVANSNRALLLIT